MNCVYTQAGVTYNGPPVGNENAISSITRSFEKGIAHIERHKNSLYTKGGICAWKERYETISGTSSQYRWRPLCAECGGVLFARPDYVLGGRGNDIDNSAAVLVSGAQN